MVSPHSIMPAERRHLILSELSKTGSVRVDDLGRRFDVSEMTIRRDLDSLEAEGLLERTHGGAMALQTVTRERRYREKDEENRYLKEIIAGIATSQVGEGETVLVNSGSTTRQVIRLLSQREDVRIVTNNLAAVMSLPDDTAAEILLLGGRFRNASGCVVGDWARRLLEEIAPSRAILGVDGISLKEGLSSPIPEEAAVSRLMMERSMGPVCVVADHHKIGRVCGFRIGLLSAVDELISDGEDDAPWREDFESAGMRVMIGAPEVSKKLKQEMER